MKGKFRSLIVACGLMAARQATMAVPVAAEPYPSAEQAAVGADGAMLPEPAGDVRLRDALALALQRSPDLTSYSWQLRAAEAREVQAGLRPNPEVSFLTEDIGVSGQTRGVDQAQMTLELGQLIELGGKRAARVEVAARGRDLAAWDYEIARIDGLGR